MSLESSKSYADISSGLDLSNPLQSAVEYLAKFSPLFNWVGIYCVNGLNLELGPYVGAPTEHTRIPIGRGICGKAVKEKRNLNIPDVYLEDNYLACSLETKSELVALIYDKNKKIVGQIDIDSHTKNAFGKREEEEVVLVAEILGQNWSMI